MCVNRRIKIMETNILMESGTNELEVLEFTVGSNHYGINVAKIKEIVPFHTITPVPNSHPNIEGIFMPRDLIITVIDLAKVIKARPSEDVQKDMFIITNFNQLNVAFHVHSVVGIHRVSWADIISPDSTVSSADSGIATGVIKINGQLIIILDFEKIVSDTESCLVENLACRFFVPKSVIRRAEAVSNPEMMPGL